MKTRKEIIEAILKENRKHSPTDQAATLEYALMGLQDAMLFQLAGDLNISIEKEAVRS